MIKVDQPKRAPAPIHSGWSLYLFLWRLRACLSWMLQHITPKTWWARRVVPGSLVVVTISNPARIAIQRSLETQQHRRLFKVSKIRSIEGPVASSRDEAR